MFSEDQLKWYDKYNKARPTHIPHGITAENINEHMKELRPKTWHLKGNMLIGETDMGPLHQTIPTDVILVGIDENNLPIFRKVDIM